MYTNKKGVKMRYITLLLSAAAFMAGCGLYTACKKDCPTQPPPIAPWHNPLQLKALQVSTRWVQLQWNNDSITVSHYYVLLRNGKDTVFADSIPRLTATETIKDSLLTPSTNYTYTLYRIYNSAHWDSATAQVQTLDTTKDNYSFTV